MVDTIIGMDIYAATSTLSKPIADATHTIGKIGFYVVELTLKSGVRGQGYLLSFEFSPNAIEGSLRDARDFLLARGYQACETVRFKREWDAQAEYFGAGGIQNCAAAVIDIAMWDCWARSLEVPVWKLFGVNANRIPVYGSGGWLSYSDDELVAEVLDYQGRGFSSVKIKVGSPDRQRDLHRLRTCRDALGPDMKIMMDANQGMTVPDALALAEDAKALGIHWFEEPINKDDYAGFELLRNKCGIAIATGEREYDCQGLKALISRNAIDMWQPDLIRMGGVGPWRNSIALANAYHIHALPHYYKDYDVPLLCTVPHAYGAESFDWIDGIIDNPMRIEAGYAYVRETPGWGFRFKESALSLVK